MSRSITGRQRFVSHDIAFDASNPAAESGPSGPGGGRWRTKRSGSSAVVRTWLLPPLKYGSAANVAEVGARFVQASQSLRRHGYRLVLDASGSTGEARLRGACSVSIRQGSPAVVEWPGR